jgi:hypothetical protein
MECGVVMPWDEYCECLRRAGREIRRKAIEQCSGGIGKSKPKRSTGNDTGGGAKSPSLF